MNVMNCKKCGKLFNYISGVPICPVCKEKLEEKYHEVKEYIREHKDANIHQICDDCKVERRQIEQWVREERLMFSEDSPVKFNCDKCGATITTGRLCAQCKKEMINGFNAGSKLKAPEDTGLRSGNGNRMHTFKEDD